MIVEAVKCLCNLVLNNHPLADTVSDMGALNTLSHRLNYAIATKLPYDIIFFDLRLLFLITACGPEQRSVKLAMLQGRDHSCGSNTYINLSEVLCIF